MAKIHPGAFVDPKARLGDDVTVGPGAVIGPDVELDEGCVIGPHALIEGLTRLGRNNRVFQFASIGAEPQDKKYRGEPTRLEIGEGNTFRECVTVNRGTAQDEGITRIGNDNWVMAYVHIAHDCQIGSHAIFANTTNLAGHVHIGDWVILGGCTQVHQFCKIGAHAMTGTGSVVLHDIPPFVMASGNSAQPHGLNTEGLRRRGFAAEDIARLRAAYKLLYRQGLTLAQAREQLQSELATEAGTSPHVRMLADFLAGVTRGIIR